MNRWGIVFLLLLVINFSRISFSQPARYPVAAISAELLKNADAVVRFDEVQYEWTGPSRCVIRHKLVVTVLREQGLSNANLNVYYDRESRINFIRGVFYNEAGVNIDDLKSSDLMDESAIPSGSLFTEDRVRKVRPLAGKYPFTAEYDMEVVYNDMIPFPYWLPQDNYGLSVEKSRLVFIGQTGNEVRHYETGTGNPAGRMIKDEKNMLIWEVSNLPALEEEVFSVSLQERVPMVYMSPVKYIAKGYAGDFTSWKSFGQWVNGMMAGRDELPETTRNTVMALAAGISDTLEKARAIYSWMQKNNRYVSIQLGIGGWQPFDAAYVADHGYGDCKALVNYMKALLKVCGISSYYTLVRAGTQVRPLLSGIPGNQFNHAILCLPWRGDTLWLECTDMNQPFGYLGPFTMDRTVLLVTGEGGKLVRTPVFSAGTNLITRNTKIHPESNGDAEIRIHAYYHGVEYDRVASMEQMPAMERGEEIRGRLGLPATTELKTTYRYFKDRIPVAEELIEGKTRALGAVSGNRLFIPVNPFFRTGRMVCDRPRVSEIHLRQGFMQSDTIEIQIPEGFRLETLPAAIDRQTDFGSYSLVCIEKGREIRVVRKLTLNQGGYPPERFPDFCGLYKEISRSDKSSIVLVRSQE